MKKDSKSLAEVVFDVIGDRWKVKIIENLLNGTQRFGELKKSLGDITQKVLTSNLRKLEEHGVLIRKVYAQIPPKVEYTLTSLGKKLKPTIDSMVDWGSEYMDQLSKKLFNSDEKTTADDAGAEEKDLEHK